MYDGDTVFALSVGNMEWDPVGIAAIAAEVVAESVKRAVLHAESVGEVLSVKDLTRDN
jgi:L-aminopeptidase/D-esterase-like protein